VGTQVNVGSLPMNIVFSPQVGSMKIDSKTKTFRLFSATPSLLTTRLLSGALFVLASMLPLPAQSVVLTGAIGNLRALQEISAHGLPRVLQFSVRFTFLVG